MKKLKLILIIIISFLLFVPMVYARGQAAERERERAPQPQAPHIPAEKPRIDPAEPIHGSPVTVLPNDVDNRVNDQGLVNVVPVRDGTVQAVGWEFSDENLGLGYNVQVNTGDGFLDSYGHLTPGSGPDVGTTVVAGETVIGTMANPTNGHSTGLHVHVERRDGEDVAVDPGETSPFVGPSNVESYFGEINEGIWGSTPHPGVDHTPGWY